MIPVQVRQEDGEFEGSIARSRPGLKEKAKNTKQNNSNKNVFSGCSLDPEGRDWVTDSYMCQCGLQVTFVCM